MKKEFIIPEINITAFETENILTSSSLLLDNAYNSATTNGGLTIDGKSDLTTDDIFTIEF